MHIVPKLQEIVWEHPRLIAIDFGSQNISYQELWEEMDGIAAQLQMLAIDSDTTVMTFLDPQPALVYSLLGILKCGAMFSPVDPVLPESRIKLLIEQANPGVIITSRDWQESINQFLEDLGREIPLLLVDDPGFAQTDEFASSTDEHLPARKNDNCYLYFTSGSTGKPKGIVGRESSLYHFIEWESEYLDCRPGLRVSLLTLQTFDPFLRDLLLPLLNAGTLCIPESRDILYDTAQLYQWLLLKKINVVHSVPTLFEQLLAQANKYPLPVELKAVLLAGEKLKPGIVQEFFQSGLADVTSLYNLYGPTETTLAKFCYHVKSSDQHEKSIPVGKPLPGTTVELLPVEQQGSDAISDDFAAGAGEIVIHTPHGSAGYLHSSEEYSDLNLHQGYATGDIGYFRQDGELVVLGRLDFQIKIDGQRVELAEIEQVIEQFDGVQAAVVCHHQLGEQPQLAAYFSETGQVVDKWELKAYLQQHLPQSWLPTFYIKLNNLPLTPNGKVDRNALPAPEWGQTEDRLHDYVPPESDLEQSLVELWQDLLGVPMIGRNDSFFELGGRSILAMRLVTQINQRLNASISMANVLASPTIASLAVLISEQQPDLSASLDQHLEQVDASAAPVITLEQQRLALFQLINPDNPVYNMPYKTRWQGHLDFNCLQQALQSLVDRHESLRTGILFETGLPVLITRDVLNIDINVRDFTGVALDIRESEIDKWLKQTAQTPIDIQQPGLLKVYAAQFDSRCYHLLFLFHHIIADAWSLEIFWRQLINAYQQLLTGRELLEGDDCIAPGLLSAYANWQQAVKVTPAYEQAKSYWLQQLANAPLVMQLPFDKNRPQETSYCGAKMSFALTDTTSQGLRELSQRLNMSLFSVCLAIFKTLLFKYTGQDDLVVGVPFANREHGKLETAIGFLVNMLCYRSYPQSDLQFESFARQIHQLNLDALQHCSMPFEDLIEALSLERSLNYSPLFQVMFAFQEPLTCDTRIRGAELSVPEMMDNGTAKYDLTLQVWDESPCIKGEFEYSSDVFSTAMIARMLKNFECLADAVVASPGMYLGDLPFVCQEESLKLIQLNQTDKPFSDNSCIQELISSRALQCPDAIAVVYEGQQITYAELERRTNQLGHYLKNMGVQPGWLVAVSIPRSIELVVGFLAVLKAGAVYVPVDPDYPESRRQYMIQDSGVGLILTVSHLVDHYRETGVELLAMDELPQEILDGNESCPDSGNGPGDVAYVIYTSGSTGNPKGVEVFHRGLCNLAEEEIALLEVGVGSRVLQFASFSFDTSVWEIVMTLVSGAALVMADRLSLIPGPDLLHQLKAQKITHVTLPASALAALPYDPLPDLKVLISAGEACSADLLQRWGKGRKFVNSYGPTETTVSATNALLDAEKGDIHIGKPLANTQVWVLDARQNLVPFGVPGELCIGGAGVAKGYLNNPQLTEEKFISNHFSSEPGQRLYRTGDLVKMLPDGNIYYLGRLDHQVKIRGFRIELPEIEIRLKQYEGVQDAIVIVRDDVIADKCLVAYVVTGSANEEVTESQLKSHLSDTLPEFMVPARIVLLDAFPRLPNNKIDRNSLPKPAAVSGVATMLDKPVTESEKLLEALWCELLGISEPGRHDSFFALGGHSLLAAKMIALLQQRHNIALSIRHFFMQPTLSYLATQLDRPQELASLQANYAGELVELTPAQQRLWFLQQQSPDSCAYCIGQVKVFDISYDPEKLLVAIQHTLSSHDVFRMRFKVVNGIPLQYLDTQSDIEPIAVERQAVSQQQIVELANQWMNEPMDLLEERGYKIRLLLNEKGNRVLMIKIHHILVDDQSLQIFENEIDSFYQCELHGPVELQDERQQDFLDYAQWVSAGGGSEDIDRSLDFWRAYLSDGVEQIELPRPLVKSDQNAPAMDVHCWDFDVAQGQLIYEYSSRLQASPIVIWLGLFTLLLRRSACTDLVNFAIPVANRDVPGTQPLIGLFLNTVLFSQSVAASDTSLAFLQKIKDNFSSVIDHQTVPLERLVDELGLPRHSQESGPVNVMFVYRDQDEATTTAPVTTFGIEANEAKFDLTLFVTRFQDRFQLKLEFNTSQVAAQWIAQIEEGLNSLAAELLQDDQRPVADCAALSQEQLMKQLGSGNQAFRDSPFVSVVDQFEKTVEQHSQDVALRFADDSMSYGELNALANQIACWILNQQSRMDSLAAGKEEKTPIAICMKRSPYLVAAIWGVLKSGNAYLPVDPEYPQDRIDYLLSNAGSRILLNDLDLDVPESICLDLSQAGDELAILSVENPDISLCEEDLVYLIYTSGSTGKPKGVKVDHGGLSHYLDFAIRHYELCQGQGSVLHSSIAFDATVTSLFAPLLSGKSLTIIPQEDSLTHLIECVQQSDFFSFIKMTPAHMDLFTNDHIPVNRFNAHYLVLGGDNLTSESCRAFKRKFPDVRIINEYGPTETVVGCCVYEYCEKHDEAVGLVPIGAPIENALIYLLDSDLQPVPDFGTGEIFIGGKGMAQGYWKLPEVSRERFIANPYQQYDGCETLYRTGDLAKRDDQELLYCLGRIDRQIKINGYRIEPGEIEALIKALDGIKDVVVLPIDVAGSTQLMAFLATGQSLDPAHISMQLGDILPVYMIPARFEFLPDFPLTSNGKIDYKALAAIANDMSTDALPDSSAASVSRDSDRVDCQVQSMLIDIWKRVLKLDHITPADSFFALGGDSIKSLQVVHQAREQGLQITVRDIFTLQSIQRIALHHQLSTTLEKQPDSILEMPATQHAHLPLMPMQHWLFSQPAEAVSRFNQAYLYHVSKDLNLDHLESCFIKLINHHESLRFGFRQQDLKWQACCIESVTHFNIQRKTVTGNNNLNEEIMELVDQKHFEFDLANPPLIKVMHIVTGDDTDRLLFVGHHSVIDNVSWQVLFSDLSALYFNHTLEQPTMSLASWQQLLATDNVQSLLRKERSFWEHQTEGAGTGLLPCGVEYAPSMNVVEDAQKLHITLEEATLEHVRTTVNECFGTRIHELLCAVLVKALMDLTQRDSVAIEVESHGRDDLNGQADLSRTIGWFTTLYPVTFDAPQQPSDAEFPWNEFIGSVKEQLRQVPRQGIACAYDGGMSSRGLDISFNYLGELLDERSDLFSGMADERIIHKYHPHIQRRNIIDLDAYVQQGKLVMEWTYGSRLLDAGYLKTLSDHMQKAIDDLVQAADSASARYLTPSDFSEVTLQQEELNALQERHSLITDMYLLTPVQEGMIFHSVFDQTVPLYHEQLVYRLKGNVCQHRFAASWQVLVARHDILRTVFELQQVSQPVQIVLAEADVAIQWIDCRSCPEPEQEAMLQKTLREDLSSPFDVAQAPLLRLAVISLSEHDHYMVISHHHCILDGWSVALLLQEFQTEYERSVDMDRMTGLMHSPDRYSNTVSFKDFVQWRIQNESVSLEYWKQQLPQGLEKTPLPLTSSFQKDDNDLMASAVGIYRQIADSHSESLMSAASRQYNFTDSTLVLATWGWLLQQLTQSDSVCFGVTSSGRNYNLPGIERMLGLTINTLPMIIQPGTFEFVCDYLAAVQKCSLDLQENSQVGASTISSDSLFDTIVVYENYPDSNLDSNDSDIHLTYEFAHEATNYPLTIVVSKSTKLSVKWVYNRQVYSESQMKQLGALFERAMTELCSKLLCRLDTCRLLDDSQRSELLLDRNRTRTPVSIDNVVTTLDETFLAHHDDVAIKDRGTTITFGKLSDRVRQVQNKLADFLDADSNALVAVYLPRTTDLVAAVIAILRSGAAYLPIDSSMPDERVRFMLEDAAAVAVITDQNLQDQLLPELPIICMDSLPPVNQEEGSAQQPTVPGGNDTAYVIYTSGSTGKPKGTPITHRGLANYLSFARRDYASDRPVNSTLHSPVSFDATITSLFLPLITGGTLHIVPEGDELSTLATTLADVDSPQLLKVTPAHLALLGEQLDRATADNLNVIVVGGEALHSHQIQALADKSAHIRIVNEYGPTETVVGCCVYSFLTGQLPEGPIPIGRPIDNTALYVLDDHGEPCPDGVTGELYISGPGVSAGYLNRPDANEYAFNRQLSWQPPENLYRTGDYVKYDVTPVCSDSDDRQPPLLLYVGRKDSQVKVRGYRIEMGELEHSLLQSPMVEQCAVKIIDSDNKRGAQLIAFVVPRANTSERELLAYARRHLPHYMVPNRWVFMSALPLTSNGKVNRTALIVPREDRTLDVSSPAGELTDTETVLLSIWSEVLGVQVQNTHDDFFLLGGHSLLAIRIVAQIQDKCQVSLPLRTVFDHPTVNSLSIEVERRQREGVQVPSSSGSTASIKRVERKKRVTREPV